jgi:hypothetical protein
MIADGVADNLWWSVTDGKSAKKARMQHFPESDEALAFPSSPLFPFRHFLVFYM